MLVILLTSLLLQLLSSSFVIINETPNTTAVHVDDVLNGTQWYRIGVDPFTYKTNRYLNVKIGSNEPYKSFCLTAGDTVRIIHADTILLSDIHRNSYYEEKNLILDAFYNLENGRLTPAKYYAGLNEVNDNQMVLIEKYKNNQNKDWILKEKSNALYMSYIYAYIWLKNTRKKPKSLTKYINKFDKFTSRITIQEEFKDNYSTSYLNYSGRDSLNAYYDSIKELLEENYRFVNYAQSKNMDLAKIKGAIDTTTKAMLTHQIIQKYIRYDVGWAADLYTDNKSILSGEQINILEHNFEDYSHLMRGMPFIPITAVDLKGDTVSVQDYIGKYIYIINWDIMYSQYLRETEEMKRLQTKYGQENIIFIGLSMYKDKVDWVRMVNKKFTFGVQLHLAGEHRRQFETDYAGAFHPRHILISPDGLYIDSNTESVVTGIEVVLDSLLLKEHTIKRINNAKNNK